MIQEFNINDTVWFLRKDCRFKTKLISGHIVGTTIISYNRTGFGTPQIESIKYDINYNCGPPLNTINDLGVDQNDVFGCQEDILDKA